MNKFSIAVDKIRTPLDGAMALYIDLCDGIGQGFEKLEPARRWIDSIAALLGRAKEAEDSLRPVLSPPEERKRLEPPRNQLPPPDRAKTPVNDLNDDIPF